jgi:hypothetical protein
METDDSDGRKKQNAEGKGKRKNRIPSARAFYASRLFEREGKERWSPILYARKLFEEYAVLSWFKVENSRLDFHRFNQPKIHTISYNGAMDACEGDHLEFNPLPSDSARVILPATFTSGPRYLSNNYYDCIQLCNVKGSPDYFLTVTCNPKWQEIFMNLFSGQTAYDRADLVVRVFKCKLEYLISRLRDGDCGTFIWGSCRIEFQQRLLPHAHIVFRAGQQFRPLTPHMINRLIHAKSPDPHTHPRLFALIQSTMMHTKCGPDHSCWDVVKNKCGSGFPKDYCEQTELGENGYVKYERPVQNPEDLIENGGEFLDNRLIVAFCAYFSLLLNCHCNLEVVQNNAVVKYLFKYINKKSDKVYVKAHKKDEIARYQEGRCVGACEAIWHQLAYPICWCSHSVFALPVHVFEAQFISYRANITQRGMLQKAQTPTALLAFFAFSFLSF